MGKKMVKIAFVALCLFTLGFFAVEARESACRANEGEAVHAGGKALVVYYSATGRTKEAAGYIASAMHADLFELTPAKAYSAADLDYTDKSSRVCKEYADEKLRKIELTSTTVKDWESYDVVFIGYPIWWGIAAWPVNSFVESNDFKGKKVIPFCTAYSSGLGESDKLLQKVAKGGEWLDGKRFSSRVSKSEVEAWVKGLGLN